MSVFSKSLLMTVFFGGLLYVAPLQEILIHEYAVISANLSTDAFEYPTNYDNKEALESVKIRFLKLSDERQVIKKGIDLDGLYKSAKISDGGLEAFFRKSINTILVSQENAFFLLKFEEGSQRVQIAKCQLVSDDLVIQSHWAYITRDPELIDILSDVSGVR